MKKSIAILSFFMVMGAGAYAQCSETVAALKSSDANALSAWFASSVELTIGDKEMMYGKEQAKRMVGDFFAKNVPATYETKHKSDAGASKYIIGTYKGKTGSFRVYVSFFSEGGREVIRTLKFENE